MSLREQIAKIVENQNAYGYYDHERALELADAILDLKVQCYTKLDDVGYRCLGYWCAHTTKTLRELEDG